MRYKSILVVFAVVLMLSSVAQASNMGFKITLPLDDTGVKLLNWVSLPYHNSYGVANDIYNDVTASGASCFDVQRWIPSGALEGFQSWRPPFFGTNFPIETGVAYMITLNTGGGGNWVVVGSHDPGFAIALDDAGVKLLNWVSIPYHFTGTVANDVYNEITASGASCFDVQRWIPSGALEGFQSWRPPFFGTNFALTPGMAVMVTLNTGGGGSWTPSHY